MRRCLISLKSISPTHPDSHLPLHSFPQFQNGEEENALLMYNESLRVERIALGNDHPDVVLTIQHLGQVYQALGNLDSALECFHEALQIGKKKYGQDICIAKLLNLIGNIYLQQGKVDLMMQNFIEASRILEGNDGNRENLTIAGYNFYGLSKTNPPCAATA
jgi:tetratricopeptide (TPR) repeat protein